VSSGASSIQRGRSNFKSVNATLSSRDGSRGDPTALSPLKRAKKWMNNQSFEWRRHEQSSHFMPAAYPKRTLLAQPNSWRVGEIILAQRTSQSLRCRSVTAPREADVTALAYLARTPRV
jgi:hypothetical protein